MFSYLLNRRGYYHVRIRVPADLLGVISSTELVKSLKTRDKREAQRLALPYLQGINKTFSLFRSGYISDDQMRVNLDSLMGRKKQAVVCNAANLPGTPVILLSKAIHQFITDRQQGWTIKTKMENEASFKLLLNIVGNVPVNGIDRDKVREIRDTLCKLPANLYKVFPDRTISAVVQRMEDGKMPPMSITSVNKHLTRFTSLMSHCVKERVIDVNPAEGFLLKQKRKPEEERKTYSSDDLKAIMKHLPQDDDRPERFWIPLIAMYSGMRLDEICQLYTADVREVDGIWCIDVNDALDKKLKTISSSRLVPVHPRLVELGLLDHVTKCQERRHPRLWMNLERREADGYGSAYGKVYQRFNRKHITDDPLKTFHSLRHTYANTLKQLGAQEALIAELMGHVNSNITTGRYGKKYRLSVLLETLRRVDFHAP
ncbi:site-specific integrase [Geomonas subterranea]|uniref:Site-specific integrase n=1 Tax=Geomonas subterranea TaxID=2847989 RepID=A0ABX8LMU2_9BACT|nr:site-specific integrase [Geomonas subterranea]QXE92809.1 site-specific integrase [Geomonas subterranea]QXM09088.1 site-specific integrase [Geomonas subterranea]